MSTLVITWILPAMVVLLLAGGGLVWHFRQRWQHKLGAAEEALSAQEAALAALEKQIEEVTVLDRAKSEVLSSMINEMRTPLMLLRGPILHRVDEKGWWDINLWASGRKMLSHVETMREIIETVGETLTLEAGTTDLDLVPTDLVAFIHRQVVALTPQAEDQGILVQFVSDPSELLCPIHPDKMAVALEGLLGRALASTPHGGKIRVHLTHHESSDGIRPDSVISLSIKDTGTGLEPEEVSILTEDGHWAQHIHGKPERTRLALALSRRIVASHGGEVEVSNEPGFGTCITLRLPLQPLQSQQVDEQIPSDGGAMRNHTMQMEPSRMPRLSPRHLGLSVNPNWSPSQAESPRASTVLIVDDHQDMRRCLSVLLRKDHNILEATDGEEALWMAQKFVPDLIITDIVMKGMDGNALCRAVKRHRVLGDVPVILMTGQDLKEIKLEGLAAGADDYLVKPFDLHEARIRICNLIDGRKRLKARYQQELVLKSADITVRGDDVPFLEQAKAIVEDHIDDVDFGVRELAYELGLSARQLQRKLRDSIEKSPVEFIRTLRLQRAAQLIEHSAGSISEVAYAVGFASLSYFAKCFRLEYGKTPSEYQGSIG